MMVESILTYIYLSAVGLAFLSSLLAFKRSYDDQLKLFSLLLGLTFLVELTSVITVKWFHKSNSWLYTGFCLIEFCAYAIFFRSIIAIAWIKKIINAFLIFYPIFWLATVIFVFGFTKWNSYAIITGGFFTVIFALAYYYQLLAAPGIIRLSKHTEFLIATGMLIFYSCQLPYLGLLNFLVKNYMKLAVDLLLVLIAVDALMYFIFTYAFLCRPSTKKY